MMTADPCDILIELTQERAPYLRFIKEKTSTPDCPDCCILDYKIAGLPTLYRLRVGGSVLLDMNKNLRESDMSVGFLAHGEKTKLPTNQVRFPENCQIEEAHFYDHDMPDVHFHIKCHDLGDKGLERLADVIVRMTRITRENAGLK